MLLTSNLVHKTNGLQRCPGDCEYFDYRHTPCKHIAAVLIAYVKRDEVQPEPSLRKKHTDKSFKEFLSSYQVHTNTFNRKTSKYHSRA